MKKKKWIWLLLVLSGILFAVVGVPVIINESYKSGTGYLTFWGPAEVLSYYGTILGAVIAVASLIITIIFTRKQIFRDSYLQSEKEKWDKIESLFANSLDSINPLWPLDNTIRTGQANPYEAITTFQQYQRHCGNPTDVLLSRLSDKDYPEVKILIDKMIEDSQKFSSIAQGSVNAYSLLQKYNNREVALKTLDMEVHKPGSFPADNINFCQNIISETNGIQLFQIREMILSSATELSDSYVDFYCPLLQLKGTTFDRINTQIENSANDILCFWRKK